MLVDRVDLDDNDACIMTEYFVQSEERTGHGYGRVLVVKGPWKPEFASFMRREGIAGLRLSDSAGWRPDQQLHFLSDLSFLRSLEIYSWDVHDCSVVSSLPNLRLLSLQCQLRKPVDFAPLSGLEVVQLNWTKAIEGVLECSQLVRFSAENWPDADLLWLGKMAKLRSLLITSRKLQSLRGISVFKGLQSLDLTSCPSLTSLEGLESCTRMDRLELYSCKAVRDLSVVGSLKGLRTLLLDSCGEIASLRPLAALRGLESLSFDGNTRILDGDLSFIEALTALRILIFAPRRSYNRTRTELMAAK